MAGRRNCGPVVVSSAVQDTLTTYVVRGCTKAGAQRALRSMRLLSEMRSARTDAAPVGNRVTKARAIKQMPARARAQLEGPDLHE